MMPVFSSLLFPLFLVVLLVLPGCGNGGEEGVDPSIGDRGPRRVQLRTVAATLPSGDMEKVGVLTAHRKVKVITELGGPVERLFFERGDRIQEEALLAEIGTSSIRLQVRQAEASVEAVSSQLLKMQKGSRPQEIQIAEAGVREAEAGLLEAERHYQRIEQLQEMNAVSNRDYDAAFRQQAMAQARVESARQQLALSLKGPREEDVQAARANLEEARAALALARDRLKKSRLSAPISGVIAYRHVEEGEVVLPGTPITEILDLDQMKIRLSLGERDIGVLEKGKHYPFVIDAFPGQVFLCELLFLSSTADTATRSFPVELLVKDLAPGMADGMTVRVRFPVMSDRAHAIQIPSAWLAEEKGVIGVFLVEEGRAQFRKVVLGPYYDQRVTILSGLEAQDALVINPSGLRSGDPVLLEENPP